MHSLNWQEVPDGPPPRAAAAKAQSLPGFVIGILTGAAVSLLLSGLIAGAILVHRFP